MVYISPLQYLSTTLQHQLTVFFLVIAAYFETADCIPKLSHMNLPPDLPVAINCEWGAFDNEHYVLPRTVYDAQIDEQSPRPGQQAFEKMIAGYYLGEILRIALLDLATKQDVGIFEKQDLSKLKIQYSLDASFLSEIERYVDDIRSCLIHN